MNRLWGFRGIGKIKYFVFISLAYVSVIYSAGLHYARGPENVFNPLYFTQTRTSYLDEFPDRGSLAQQKIKWRGPDVWKMATFCDDSIQYLRQAESLSKAKPPFRYRILPAVIVSFLSRMLNMRIENSFLLMNIMAVYLSAIVLTSYLKNDLMFSPGLSFIGGLLFVSMSSVTKTLPFPMLEPVSMLFAVLICRAVVSKNILLFVVSSACGVLTKEILIISAVMWFVENFAWKDKKGLFFHAVVACVPIIVFVVMRKLMGGGALEVNYGHDILRGEFPVYWKRLLSVRGCVGLMIGMFLSFCFLWLGLFNLNKIQFLRRQIIIIPLVMFAAVVLSGRIIRVMGIVYPIVIPLYLLFFAERNDKGVLEIKSDQPAIEAET